MSTCLLGSCAPPTVVRAAFLSGQRLVQPRSAQIRRVIDGVWAHRSMHCASPVSCCEAVTSLLQIRNVPDDARRVLKARAAARGESLNSYLLAVLGREVAQPTVAEVLLRAARRAEHATTSAMEVLQQARAERGEQLQRSPVTGG